MSFAELLSKKVEEVEAPKPLPIGDYLLEIEDIPEQTISTQKKTPGLKFHFITVAADEQVPKDLIEGLVPGKRVNSTFWVTPDALSMLTEFLKKLGLTTGLIAENVLKVQGKRIWATATQRPADDGRIFNDLSNWRAA